MKTVLIAVGPRGDMLGSACVSRRARRLRPRLRPARISLRSSRCRRESDEFKEIDVMSGGWPAGGDIPFKYTQYEGQ